MSVQFDKSNEHGAGDWLKADGSALAPTSFSFSVSLWVYFEEYGTNDPETIWYFGDQSENDDDFIVLEAFPDPVTDEVRVRARMKDDGTELKTGDSGVLSVGDWHLVTVVVGVNDDELEQITLYVDAQSAVTASADLGTTNEGTYDRFALGRRADASLTNDSSSCHCEQVAIWDSELTSGNHGTLRADPEGEEFVRRPPSHLSPEPDLGYWVLAGHHRHGLLVSDDSTQSVATLGDRNNEAGASQPDMQLGHTSFEPLWSCETPAVLYDDTRTPEGGNPARSRKVRPSRHNPQFFVYSRPENNTPWFGGTQGIAWIYGDPNFVIMARVHHDNVNGAKWTPPDYDQVNLTPPSYMTQVAKAVADWQEYQGFIKGRGSEGDGDYEGTVFLQDLGWQHHRDGVRGLEPAAGGAGWGIPLEQHPHDKATGGLKDWACWFRAKGEKLTREYSDKFWPLLKAELDRRDLCYPKRLHMDVECSPEPSRVAPGVGNHTFDPMLTDGRATSEVLVGTETLNDLWTDATTAGITYDKDNAFDHPNNAAWRIWYLSWQSPIRQQALADSIMSAALTQFPEMVWSNYLDFVADNEDYKYFQYDPDEIRNSPVSTIPADYSSPLLYPTTKRKEIISAGYGVTAQAAQLHVWRDAIDACVNTSSPLPVCPWITSVGYRDDSGNGYEMTREDLRHLLWYYWQRGVNEFALWVTGDEVTHPNVDLKATYEECGNLAKTVKCMMNTNGSRTSRMGRTYRICR